MRTPRRLISLVSLAIPVLALQGCYTPNLPIRDDASASGAALTTDDASSGPSDAGSETDAHDTSVSTEAESTDNTGVGESTTSSVEGVCGDGQVDGEEVCDDGTNDGSYGGCEPGCSALAAHCGDAIQQGGEACDDGDAVNGNGCNIDCAVSGSELWTRMLGAGTYHRVAIDEDDGVVAVGENASGLSAAIQQVLSDGDEGWSASFDDLGATYTRAWGVARSPTGEWVVGGSAAGDIWWRTYSSEGNFDQYIEYDNPAQSTDHIGGVAFDGSGDLYVFGGSDRSDLGQGDNVFLRKYSPRGNELWTQTYDGGDDDHAAAIAVASDGYIVVGGYTTLDAESRNAWVRKYGPEGNTEWTRSSAGPGTSWDEVRGIAVGPNLEVVAVGTQGNDLWIRKYSPMGDVEWTAIHGDPFVCVQEGCALSDSGNGVAIDSAGAVVVAGDQMTSIYGVDTWIRKYDSDGHEMWTSVVEAPDPTDSLNQSAHDVVIASNDDIIVVGGWDETGVGGGVVQWVRRYAP